MGHLTLVTHNKVLANILRNRGCAQNVLLIDRLLYDTNSYVPSEIGVTSDFVPNFLKCSDEHVLVSNLLAQKKLGDIRIVLEPRLDAICWAQQIASVLNFNTTDKIFVLCDATRDVDIRKLLRTPTALPVKHPSEWFYMRMVEGAVTANISANIDDGNLGGPLPLQNLYSLYLLFKLYSLLKRIKNKEYSIVLRDTLSGVIVGEHIPPPSDDNVFMSCASHYEDRVKAERVLSESTGELNLQYTQEVEKSLPPQYFPTLSMVFSRILRHTVFPIGAIFNELYKLYGGGCVTYPFSTTGNDPEKIRNIVTPLLDTYKLKVSASVIDKLHAATIDTISCLPLIGPEVPEDIDHTIQNYIETLTLDAFRMEFTAKTYLKFYKLGAHYYVARLYAFKGMSNEAINALGYLYPMSIKSTRLAPYIRTVSAKDRVPFHTLMGFTMRSPHWLKWFIALHYLLEKRLLAMDGECVCVTKNVINAFNAIEKLYGPLFQDDAFPAFDTIFNNVDKHKGLCAHLIALLPTLEPNTQEKIR